MYQYTLAGDDLQELQSWAPRVVNKLKTLPGLTRVQSDLQNHGLEVFVDIDRETASRLGITTRQIDDLLYDAFGQRQVSTVFKSLNQYHVVMEVSPEFAQDPGALDNVYAHAAGGEPIPLSAFAKFSTQPTPLTVTHQAQFPCVTISFNLLPGASLGNAVDAIQAAVAEMHLPPTIQGVFDDPVDAALGGGGGVFRVVRDGGELFADRGDRYAAADRDRDEECNNDD
jgi:multidrug efflux pump